MKNKDQLRRQLQMIESLEEDINDILDDCILIGSRAWGVETEDSDYDYLIDNAYPLTMVIQICQPLELKREFLQGSSSSENHRIYNTHNIKVQFQGKMLNFIAYDKEDL